MNILNWTPIFISKGGTKVSRLFFIYDLTLFARVDSKNYETIMNTLDSFSNHSTRKSIPSNPKLFSLETDLKWIGMQCKLPYNSSQNNFGKYLGFSIFFKNSVNSDFLDNLKSKLVGWKINFLNMARRTTIAKASLSNIPNHVM